MRLPSPHYRSPGVACSPLVFVAFSHPCVTDPSMITCTSLLWLPFRVSFSWACAHISHSCYRLDRRVLSSSSRVVSSCPLFPAVMRLPATILQCLLACAVTIAHHHSTTTPVLMCPCVSADVCVGVCVCVFKPAAGEVRAEQKNKCVCVCARARSSLDRCPHNATDRATRVQYQPRSHLSCLSDCPVWRVRPSLSAALAHMLSFTARRIAHLCRTAGPSVARDDASGQAFFAIGEDRLLWLIAQLRDLIPRKWSLHRLHPPFRAPFVSSPSTLHRCAFCIRLSSRRSHVWLRPPTQYPDRIVCSSVYIVKSACRFVACVFVRSSH